MLWWILFLFLFYWVQSAWYHSLRCPPPSFGKIYFPAQLQPWLHDLIWPMECEEKWKMSFQNGSFKSQHKLSQASFLLCHDCPRAESWFFVCVEPQLIRNWQVLSIVRGLWRRPSTHWTEVSTGCTCWKYLQIFWVRLSLFSREFYSLPSWTTNSLIQTPPSFFFPCVERPLLPPPSFYLCSSHR